MAKPNGSVTACVSLLAIFFAGVGLQASDELFVEMPNPFAPVAVHKESRGARWRHGFHDIRKTWDKYFEVYPEELDGFEPVEYSRVRGDPAFFLDRKIRFELYFGKIGSFYRPVVSPFQEDTYVNFSAWPYGAPLWTKEGRMEVHPLFYIDKRKKDVVDKLMRLPKFAPIHVWAEVRSKSDNTPWIEILAFETLPEPFLDETALRQIEMGYVQLGKKRHELSITALESSLQQQLPVNVEREVYTMLARGYYEQRSLMLARNALANAILRDKSNVQNLILLARTDLRLNRPDEAQQAAELAVTLEPASATAHAELGLALAMLGDIRAGYKEVEYAQKLARNQLPEAHRNRAMIALLENKPTEALKELKQAIILRPTDVDLKLEIGLGF